MDETELPDNRVYCVDCGVELTGKKHFRSPTKSPHCARCVHPTRLDRLLRDQQVRVLALQMLLLAAAAFWAFDFIASTAGAR